MFTCYVTANDAGAIIKAFRGTAGGVVICYNESSHEHEQLGFHKPPRPSPPGYFLCYNCYQREPAAHHRISKLLSQITLCGSLFLLSP